jgi:hypothetical protein
MFFSSGDLLLAANMAPLAFNALLAMAALGAPIIAVLLEILAAAQSKVFYKKAAQQISALGLGCTAYTVFVALGTGTLIYLKIPGLLPFQLPEKMPLLWMAVPLTVWAVVTILHATTWKFLKKPKALHISLGVVASLAALCTIYSCMAVKYAYVLPIPGERAVPETFAKLFMPTNTPMFYALTLSTMVLAPFAAGALGLGYIQYRRKRDDWGRDYYVFALRFVSGLTLFLGVAFLASQVWVAQSVHQAFAQLVFMQNIIPAWYIGLGICSLAAITWGVVWRSRMPMRFAGLLISGGLLVWLMLTCLGFAGLKLFFLY